MKHLLFIILTISILSACKKSNDPKTSDTTNPTDTTKHNNGGGNGGNNPTNHAPTFSSTSTTTTSDGTSQTINLSVSDTDNDSLYITNITGASSNITISNISGTTFKITPTNSTYAGTENLSITISDGSLTTTHSFTLNVGTVSQISTYSILNSYLNRPLSFITGNTYAQFIGSLTIDGNGNVSASQAQAPGEFFVGSGSSGTYIINSSGNLILTAGAINITYAISKDVSTTPNMIVFTKLDNWNSSCNCGSFYSFQ